MGRNLVCVAQRLERATDDRVVAGSNPTGAAWKLWQVRLPHIACVSRLKPLVPSIWCPCKEK